MNRKMFTTNLKGLTASLLVAFALFANIGCSPSDNVADSNHQARSISQRGVENMKADWSHLPQHLQDAIAIQEENTSSLMSISGVNGVSVGQGEDNKARIIVFTERQAVSGIPAELRGLKIHVEHIGKIQAFGKPPAGYRAEYRPVPSGVSIGNDAECAAGTLGCVVKSVTTGQRMVLSNWHVLSGPTGNPGRINQPGRYDKSCNTTGAIATNFYLHPISTVPGTTNVVDAGVAVINEGIVVTRKMADNTTPTVTPVAPSVNMLVKKVGRTTGVTTGKISGINTTINVGYGHGTATFTNQIYVAGRFIQSGDSGSLMTQQQSGHPVGLCFAGSSNSSFANPIGPVLNACGVIMSED